MSQASVTATVESIAQKLIVAGVNDLLPLAEGAVGNPVIAGLVKGLMALPPVRAEVTHLEALAAEEIGNLAGKAEAALAGLVGGFLRGHPTLKGLYEAVEGSPLAGQVATEAEKVLGPVLKEALSKLDSMGRLGELESWLRQAGVLS